MENEYFTCYMKCQLQDLRRGTELLTSTRNDSTCLRTFGATGGFEFNCLAFSQRFIPIGLDR